MTIYTLPQVYQMAVNAGFAPGSEAAQMTAVIMGESGGNDSATNTNGQALGVSTDYGIAQINSHYWPQLTNVDGSGNSPLMGDAQGSLNAARTVFTQGGGFGQWVSTNGQNSAYNAALPQAQAYAAANPGITANSAPAPTSGTLAGDDTTQFDGESGFGSQNAAFSSPGGAGANSSDPMGWSVGYNNSPASSADTQPAPGSTYATMGSAGAPIGIATGGTGGTTASIDGSGVSSTGAPAGTSTQGSGNFYSTLGTPADNATTDAPVTANVTTGNVPGVNAPANPSAATAPSGTATNTNAGTPIANNITDATAVGQSGLNAVAKAATGVGSSVTSATGSAITAGTSWLGSIFGGATNLLVRFGFLSVGLVVLLGAFLFFFIDSKGAPSVTVTGKADL